MSPALLILNAGSSSLKFALYQPDAAGALHAVQRGQVDALGAGARMRVTPAADAGAHIDTAVDAPDHARALECVLDWLDAQPSRPGR